MAKQSRPLVILTRPAAQSARFAAAITARFGALPILISPLMEPEFLAPPVPDRQFSALVLTSQTAVQALAGLQGPLPRLAFCVGDRTAAAAARAGLHAISAQGDAAELIALIQNHQPAPPLLHLRGRDSRGDIATSLTEAGIETLEAVVYDQRPRPLTDEARAALSGTEPVLCPVFSPRTAALLGDAMPRPHAPLQIAAISAATAAALGRCSLAALEIASRPDAAALLDAMAVLLARNNATDG